MESKKIDIDVVDNDIYSPEFCSKAQKVSSSIKTELSKIEKSFLKVSVSLYWIDQSRAYEILGGYSSITDYARNELGIKKSLCYNLICIAERFGKFDNDGNIIRIDDKFKDYSVSKLTAMTSLTDSEIENVSPDMTVKDIKKYVKECENIPVDISPNDSCSGDLATEDDTSSKPYTLFYFSNSFDLLKALSDYRQSQFDDCLEDARSHFGVENFDNFRFKIIVERNN